MGDVTSLLTVRLLAQGTLIRTGSAAHDFTPVEALSPGDPVFDPLAGRFHDITAMTCLTLDRQKARMLGMDLYRLDRRGPGQTLVCAIESPDLSRGQRRPALPDQGGKAEEAVFYGLRFDLRVVIDTGAALCEIR